MEGLKGTAIRLAVRDPSCPQGPGPGWSSVAPVSVRGPSCGWQRPRPPIPVPAPRLRAPGRRVAHGQRGSGGRRRAARISTEGSTPRCRLRVTRHQPPPPRSPDPFGLRRGLSRASGTEGMHGSGRQAPRSTEGASGPGAGRRWLAMCPLGAVARVLVVGLPGRFDSSPAGLSRRLRPGRALGGLASASPARPCRGGRADFPLAQRPMSGRSTQIMKKHEPCGWVARLSGAAGT
jgi:hypothetical protein